MTDTAPNPPILRTAPTPLRTRTLRQEMDRLFDEFDGFSNFFAPRGLFSDFARSPTLATPAVDITEKDKTYEVTAELPGMTECDVQVEVQNGELRIKGEKKEVREDKTEDRYLAERRYGAFERRFALPRSIDANKIEAAFQNGVLTVTIPKSADAEQATKKIAVKAS